MPLALVISPAGGGPDWVHYLPIATTVMAVLFVRVLLRRYFEKGCGTHLLWWAFGVACYGSGTALESAITLTGNSVALNKTWYVAGAILGGYPLAQGSVFLLFPPRTARRMTAISLPVVLATAILVCLSPVHAGALQPHRPGGAILAWTWVRAITPLINGYAALFLVGGAILSAVRFARRAGTGHRVLGNTLIATGALLPGIGGAMAKTGRVDPLYVAELLGLALLWTGHRHCVTPLEAGTGAVTSATGCGAGSTGRG